MSIIRWVPCSTRVKGPFTSWRRAPSWHQFPFDTPQGMSPFVHRQGLPRPGWLPSLRDSRGWEAWGRVNHKTLLANLSDHHPLLPLNPAPPPSHNHHQIRHGVKEENCAPLREGHTHQQSPGGWRDHPRANHGKTARKAGQRNSFGTKPTWIQIHLLPTIKHVTLGNCLSSLGLGFQMCKMGSHDIPHGIVVVLFK